MKISIISDSFRNDDGTFNKDKALMYSGVIAGVCYDEEGYEHKKKESEELTKKRIKRTLESGHHSVYDHVKISFNMQGIPKILAMILNNEHDYVTSEKSSRYTKIEKKEDSIISDKEIYLYNKWFLIFKDLIEKQYGNIYNKTKIKTLSQENARYMVSVFAPTEMIYTTSLRQINYIASWFLKFIKEKPNVLNNFYQKNVLYLYMKEFVDCLDSLNVLVEELMTNEKERSISLFDINLDQREEYFGNNYCTNYQGSLAMLAQLNRHRTIDYQMEFMSKKTYFVPPILTEQALIDEWLSDISSVDYVHPQGEIVLVNEMGKYNDFILKCQERLCYHVQLETMLQEKKTLLEYQKSLKDKNHYLYEDICKYTKGARCTFPNYTCKNSCLNKDGINLTRKI